MKTRLYDGVKDNNVESGNDGGITDEIVKN